MQEKVYLKSIDGLRAISVLAVIAFHYFPELDSSGYLGVDVFFVISGFVITASISQYPEPSNLKLFVSQFLLRRLMRLLPAALFVTLIMGLLSLLVISSPSTGMRTAALSLVGVANIFLYIQAQDYFGIASELNPFTHMWSLAVEDQFYILFPLFVWFFSVSANRNWHPSKLLKPILILFAISIVLFFLLNHYDPAFAFYMSPTRLWEIAAGVFAYLIVEKTTGENVGKMSVFLKPLLPVIALILILVFGVPIAGLNHLCVVIATVITLIAIWQNRTDNSFLSTSLFSYLGKLSYSLYLWHWPVLVLAKHTFGVTISIALFCLIITFVMAAFSYHYIENRFRIKGMVSIPELGVRKLRNINIGNIATIIFLAGIGPELSTQKNSWLAKSVGVPDLQTATPHECNGTKSMSVFDNALEHCLNSKRTATYPNKFYLFGDSHGNQLTQMISDNLVDSPYRLQFANFDSDKRGINALISIKSNIPKEIRYMIDNADAGDIFALTFHRGRLNKIRDQHISEFSADGLNKRTSIFVNNSKNFLKELSNKGVSKLLILDTPLMGALATSQTCAMQILFTGTSICEIDEETDRRTRHFQKSAFETLKVEIPSIKIWDPLDTIYATQNTIDVFDGEKYLMYDNNHMTQYSISKLAPVFRQQITNFR